MIYIHIEIETELLSWRLHIDLEEKIPISHSALLVII